MRTGRTAQYAASVSLSPAPQMQPMDGPPWLLVGAVVALVLALVAGVCLLVLLLRRRRKPPRPTGISLADWSTHGPGPVDEYCACQMLLSLLAEMQALPAKNRQLLLRPGNIYFDGLRARLWETRPRRRAKSPLPEGFAAPELYDGQGAEPAQVYFAGAVLYALLAGKQPPDARVRRAYNAPAFTTPDALQAAVNHAMAPYIQSRIAGLALLQQQLLLVAARLPTACQQNNVHPVGHDVDANMPQRGNRTNAKRERDSQPVLEPAPKSG